MRTTYEVDPSVHPDREREQLERRLRQLRLMQRSLEKFEEVWSRINGVQSKLGGQFKIRTPFAYQAEPAPEDSSDRRLPARKYRPPATRLVSPRGAALRLYLTALAEAQTRAKAGTRPINHRPLLPPDNETVAWVDLVVSPMTSSGAGRTRLSARDKKLRQLQSALARLASDEVQLVDLPYSENRRRGYEGFQLLDERGTRPLGEPMPYKVPTDKEDFFNLPTNLITRGWIHLLTDTEISLLLMVACKRGSIPAADGFVAIPGEIRLMHYGIGRDKFSDAANMLDRLGLLAVMADPARNKDSTVQSFHKEGTTVRLHRLLLRTDGFINSGSVELVEELEHQLARSR